MTSEAPQQPGHLAYYTAKGISPVRYDIGDREAHFDRRDAVYRSLGLPAAAFKGCAVLEVAPGSGHNSLYIAHCGPASYDLVEPNPVGVRDIRALYQSLALPHTAPRIHAMRFEEFAPGRTYDIVLCENWLSSLPHERTLIRKLAGLVAPGGVLVLTITPFSGFVPNVLRKLLALRILKPDDSFELQTSLLLEAFSSHLSTIDGMTRSYQDWVQDCLLNPHYLNIVLPLDTVIHEIGDTMEALSCAPAFRVDWRWFKTLVGPARAYNERLLRNYLENLHNLLDYRRVFPARSAADNAGIDRLSRDVHAAALGWCGVQPDADADRERAQKQVHEGIRGLASEVRAIDPSIAAAFEEAADLWGQPKVDAAQIREMRAFAGLFGRETIYVSFTRRASIAPTVE